MRVRLYKRGDRWWIDYRWNGKRHRYPVSSSRKTANEALSRIEVAVADGSFRGPLGQFAPARTTIQPKISADIAQLVSVGSVRMLQYFRPSELCPPLKLGFVYGLISSGQLEAFKVPGSDLILIPESAVNSLLSELVPARSMEDGIYEDDDEHELTQVEASA